MSKEKNPIWLKQALLDCGISQSDMVKLTGGMFQKTTAGLYLNYGRLPLRSPEEFEKAVKDMCSADGRILRWLGERELKMDKLFEHMGGDSADRLNYAIPKGCNLKKRVKPLKPGNPEEIEESEDAEMLSRNTMKHYKIFRDPFRADVNSVDDVFFSEDHIFLREMMLDTAKHGGFTAITGEVGSGKSTMRKAVVELLKAEDVTVIYPMIVDKERITPTSLLEAVILDMGAEKVRQGMEAKTRQAMKLLKARTESGLRQVLIIEEAHLLNPKALKTLKQFYEFEDGFTKMLAIILIGQTELDGILDETRRPEIREVIRRVTRARINGLGEALPSYVEHKFKKVNKKPEDIFDNPAEVYDAVARRLGNHTYPLSVNNLLARAMNTAVDYGEDLVSAEVVLGA